MTPRRGRPCASWKRAPAEGRERRLVENAGAVCVDFGDRVLVGEGNVDGVVVAGDAGGGGAANGVAALLADLGAEAQLGGDRRMLAVGHVIGPERAAPVGVLIAQAGNLLAFDGDALAGLL